MPSLFTITTDRLRLTWSGPPAPPDPAAPPGCFALRGLREGAALRAEGEPMLRLAEQTPYRLFVTSRCGEPVQVRHRDPVIVGRLAEDDDGRVVAGPVDFGGQVGRSRFMVTVGGEDEVAFELDVVPTKVSHRAMEQMRTEIDEALAGLAFEYLRATQAFSIEAAVPPRRATWLTLLRRTLPGLEQALGQVAARPHRDLRREARPVRVEQVQRAGPSVLRAVRQGQGSGAVERFRTGRPVRSVLPTRRALATLDTTEHRWLRARLVAARRTLTALQAAEAARPLSARRRRVLADLDEAETRLARMLSLAPLVAASPGPVPAPTQRLVAAPGYAEAHAACRVLDLSLALAAGPVPHATKNLHLLYELWTYLTLVQAVADVLGQPVPPSAFFQAEHRGIRFLLRRGRGHGVAFEQGGRRVRLAYNPHFSGRTGLMAQRPDILMTVEDGGRPRRFVLDAKYRRDDSPAYARRYGAAGPPEDALGDLHRYRDAIVETQAGRAERTIDEAVALFPGAGGEAFGESRLWTAIGRIGVGALPLVPGETAYLSRWLRRALGG
ncbi:MAG: DUF2357 domain-containing protein [Bacteroidota bacterium]